MQIAPDQWTGKPAEFPSLPATHPLSFALLGGPKRVGWAGKIVRPAGRARTKIENFGSPVVTVRATTTPGWDRLVAVLTATTPTGKEIVVSAGAVATRPGTRTYTFPLFAQIAADSGRFTAPGDVRQLDGRHGGRPGLPPDAADRHPAADSHAGRAPPLGDDPPGVVIHLGTCSWADDGLIKKWYPKGVSSPQARLAYYAERFDTVEVDSPFYRLPSPETSAKWAERTPDGFVFHAKASAAMTGHEEADRDQAFAEFREALAPLEQAGKLRAVLLQYPPRFKKSKEALAELEAVAPLLDPLVPLIEFRHRSWVEEDERADTFAFLEQHGLVVRLGRLAARERART